MPSTLLLVRWCRVVQIGGLAPPNHEADEPRPLLAEEMPPIPQISSAPFPEPREVPKVEKPLGIDQSTQTQEDQDRWNFWLHWCLIGKGLKEYGVTQADLTLAKDLVTRSSTGYAGLIGGMSSSLEFQVPTVPTVNNSCFRTQSKVRNLHSVRKDCRIALYTGFTKGGLKADMDVQVTAPTSL